MSARAEQRFPCIFDISDPGSNFANLDRLAEEESCPHIRKAQPKIRGVELYAVMDSNCLNPPSAPHGRCNKNESSLLRLLVKKENMNRSTKPQAVTCTLTSYRADLLKFTDGHVTETKSVLELKERPLWVAPIYQKTAKCNCSDTSVRLEKIPDYELRQVPLQIDVAIWKNYPEGNFSSQQTVLLVTIPPQHGKDDSSTNDDARKHLKSDERPRGLTADSELVEQQLNTPLVQPEHTHSGESKKKRTVVELDLVGYSTICDNFEQGLDVSTVAQLNEQIQSFIDIGLKSTNGSRERNVMVTTGDGAILVFELAQDAHTFTQAVHEATQQHNRTRKQALAKRVFRSGAATGEIVVKQKAGGGYDIAGMTIARAVRLEAKAEPGGFLVDEATYEDLFSNQKTHYGPKTRVAGKRDEEFEAYACQLNTDGPEDSAFFVSQAKNKTSNQNLMWEPSGDKRRQVLSYFDVLKSHQYIELIFLLNMPIGQRPSDALTLEQQKAQVLRWSDENAKLDLLVEVLQELTTRRHDTGISH